MRTALLLLVLAAAVIFSACATLENWTVDSCVELDLATFAESYVCRDASWRNDLSPEKNAELCHHTMMAAFHTGKAACIGASAAPAEPS
jgi:hypothetical protein